ncbi:ammonium transporter [Acaryochloris sp. CCMEE 5410]|uniref:ammonium transporter n=1 Tax=Acaryochloris sp. CCMEE 5410 TaxID=310037 RepID=UPI0004942997|nr:ammonium transporter [Acaryochloris sp. CCMEE 5410]KAI9131077.1 ammonium transporter [Acaryochloris sp. CCMEE 5410]
MSRNLKPKPPGQPRHRRASWRWSMLKKPIYLYLTAAILLVWSSAAVAQEAPSSVFSGEAKVVADTIWVLFAASLVFFMNAGFAMLETGLCRSKNAVNLLAKNLIVFGLVSLAYWSVGFGIMFGDGNEFMGTTGFFLGGNDNSPAIGEAYDGVFSALNWAGIPLNAKFFYQLMFAGTAATIVSGAIAERARFVAFFIFSILLTSICYPMVGHWVWGGGFLQKMGFVDFAGSTVVHMVGGWAALVGAALIGPRTARYFEGKSYPIPGHNLSIATLGGLILWLGWFGFNGGSTMAADPAAISHIIVVTNLAGAAGGVAGTLTAWIYFGKPDLTMTINGMLIGLVSITAGCAFVTSGSAVLIGFVGGIAVVFAVDIFDNFKIDDPVGALSVHMVGGFWGTLAVGLFSVGPERFSWYTANSGPASGLFSGGSFEQVGIQLLGLGIVSGFTVLFSYIVWTALKYLSGIRVTLEDEKLGLDLSEHAMEAYPGFLGDEHL